MTTDSKRVTYRCTHWGCSGTFGSVDDWKKHERNHIWPEMWRSDEGKVFYKRHLFEAYLEHERGIDVNCEEWKERIKNCHIGARHQQRFWCGCCGRIVASEAEALDCFEYRFQHILDHNSTQWISLVSSSGDTIPQESSQKLAVGRKQFVEQTFSQIFEEQGHRICLPFKGRYYVLSP
ncbi:hypothetical protein F5884DRAFT_814424 [Xylogone sp. PMI_703]|nr:hypothetical protein F5884DRAFT_814424 [Xylogone sp. PMI_703]